uniref:Uncharacterized protein n=1 Tax=Rhizophagus irregularis (strain DAOM 181602 / DAOM 197198 / MUCL 43194) TaxID=747089 RepID=U9TND7_RHIID
MSPLKFARQPEHLVLSQAHHHNFFIYHFTVDKMVDAFTGVRRKRGSQLPNLQDSRLPPQIRTDLDPIGMDFLFIGDRQLSDYESIY